MAYPIVRINNVTGSDTAASGAGPDPAITGTQASTSADGLTVDLSADNPDLSGVASDGSHVIWLSGTGGREFAQIVGVDNVAKTITVQSDSAYPANLTGLTWAIGGKRKTVDGSTAVFADRIGYWVVELEYTGTDYTFSAGITLEGGDGTLTTGQSPDRYYPPEFRGTFGPAGEWCVLSTTADVQLYVKGWRIRNLDIRGPGTAVSTKGGLYAYYSNMWIENVLISGFSYGVYVSVSATGHCLRVKATNCSIGFNANTPSGVVFDTCIADGNTSHGFKLYRLAYSTAVTSCISSNNGGAGFWLNVTNSGSRLFLSDSTAVDNTGDGITVDNSAYYTPRSFAIWNCICYGNGGYGINRTSDGTAFKAWLIKNLAMGSNTSGNVGGTIPIENLITLTQDPFIDRANGNYNLNDYGKQVLQDAGWPSTWPGLPNTTSYPDIGAVEEQAGGGSQPIYVPARRSKVYVF